MALNIWSGSQFSSNRHNKTSISFTHTHLSMAPEFTSHKYVLLAMKLYCAKFQKDNNLQLFCISNIHMVRKQGDSICLINYKWQILFVLLITTIHVRSFEQSNVLETPQNHNVYTLQEHKTTKSQHKMLYINHLTFCLGYLTQMVECVSIWLVVEK